MYVQDKDCKILDVGAGTGLLGEELRKAGFKGRIDAIEPAPGMLKRAEEKGCYENFYSEYVTVEKPCSISTGGYVLACFRKDYLEKEHFRGFDDFLEKLQRDRKCKSEIVEIDQYHFSDPGLVVVLEKTSE
ncbi:uncharacterized protein LOC141901282 [Tubulanus polymorphus]|uniref:uncharacterized protein LOC141901282 n=1 Tax=Tubulanus polymorphus TaxID=672921 RepID=UPI003DA5F75C